MLAQASETARHLQVEVDQVITPTSQESRNKVRYFLHGVGLGLACLCLLGISHGVLQASHHDGDKEHNSHHDGDKEHPPERPQGPGPSGIYPPGSAGFHAPTGIRGRPNVDRSSTILNSHLTKVETEIRDEPILKKTLMEMGFEVQVAAEVPQELNMDLVSDQELWTKEMTVTSLDGSKVVADVIAKQQNANGQHIAFKNVDGKYQILTDVDGWKQSVPLEVWKDKLSQKYAINVVKDSAKDVGFDVESTKVSNEGVVELVMERYQVAEPAR